MPMPSVEVGSKEVYLLPQHDGLQTVRRSPVCDFHIIAAIAPVPLGLPETLSWCTWAQARLNGAEKRKKVAGISRFKL
jgi:hypothetical protein